ncbi:hypothetical protein RSAG8_02943, partial [Rhizoctonia solani AG-8 WAC10335]
MTLIQWWVCFSPLFFLIAGDNAK